MCKATKCYKSAKVGGGKYSLVGQNGKLVGQPPYQLYRKLRPCFEAQHDYANRWGISRNRIGTYLFDSEEDPMPEKT